MPKLQRITRKDGTQIYFFYIPKSTIEEAALNKGDDLEVTCTKEGKIEVEKL